MNKRLQSKLERLKKNGRWGLRISNDGIGYAGFKWNGIGVWTVCPKGITGPGCQDGGLFFQGPGGYGQCSTGNRMEIVESDKLRIVVDGDKVKSPRCKILCINGEAMGVLVFLCDDNFPGRLYLRGCDLGGVTLPTTVGGSLDLGDCDLSGVTLPTTVGGWLDLSGCDLSGVALPTTVGGWLNLSGCDLGGVTLPTTVGGEIYK